MTLRERRDCRSEVTEGLFRGKNLIQYLIVVFLELPRNVEDLSKCLFVHNIPSFGNYRSCDYILYLP